MKVPQANAGQNKAPSATSVEELNSDKISFAAFEALFPKEDKKPPKSYAREKHPASARKLFE